MKFLIFFLIFVITCQEIYFYDLNDAAHFKYYQNNKYILYWYEWWYANLKTEKNIIIMFFTIGNLNNPFLSLVGAFVSILDDDIEKITIASCIDCYLDYKKCNVSIAGNRFYEKNGIYIIKYNKGDFSLIMKIYPYGMPFGNQTMLNKWQFTAWYVSVPYGKGEAWIKYKGKEYYVKGKAYHDHNWGISKKMKWDWGEFSCKEFAIIYGIAESRGGLYFVDNNSYFFFKIEIEYLEWKRINGIRKPAKLHLYGKDVDLFIELERAYTIWYKPYLLGKAYGNIKINGKLYEINSIGFYEHHY